MAPRKIMFIRHAERPVDGVLTGDRRDRLPQQEWPDCARVAAPGALVPFFGSAGAGQAIEQPTALFAENQDAGNENDRSRQP